MVDVNPAEATGARALLDAGTIADLAGRDIGCPTCDSAAVGVAWTPEGLPRMISCRACKSLWTRAPATGLPVGALTCDPV